MKSFVKEMLNVQTFFMEKHCYFFVGKKHKAHLSIYVLEDIVNPCFMTLLLMIALNNWGLLY